MVTSLKMTWRRGIVLAVILFGVSFLSALPFIFYTDIYGQHDIIFHISRLEAYYESVKHFEFFPKIFDSLGNGGGYAVDLFYPSIFLFPYAVFRLFGLTPGVAYAYFYLLLGLITAGSSYFLGKHIFNKTTTNILLAVCYTLSAYRFNNVVMGGALGQVFGFAFIPIAFIGLHSIFFKDKKNWYYLPICMTLLLLSHNISAYLLFFFIIFLLIYQFFTRDGLMDFWDRFQSLLMSGLWTALLSMWQILPILEQSAHLKYNFSHTALIVPTDTVKHMIHSSLLCNIIGLPDRSYYIGTFFIFIIGCLWLLFFKLDRVAKIGLLFGTVLMLLPTSLFPWHFFVHTPLRLIQFPSRLFILCTLVLSLLISYVFEKIMRAKQSLFFVLTILAIVLSLNLNYSFTPTFLNIHHIGDVASNPSSFGAGQEYVKAGYRYETVVPASPTDVDVSNNDLETFRINYLARERKKLTIHATASGETEVVTPFLYYYGYQSVDSKGAHLKTYEKDGKVAFMFPKGENEISIFYEKTLLQRLSMMISLVSIVLFVGIVVKRRSIAKLHASSS